MEAETALTDRRVRQCAPRYRTRIFFETTEGDTNDFDDTLDDSSDADNDRDLSRQESIADFTETTGATSTRMTGYGSTTSSIISVKVSRTEDTAASALFNANQPALDVESDDG